MFCHLEYYDYVCLIVFYRIIMWQYNYTDIQNSDNVPKSLLQYIHTTFPSLRREILSFQNFVVPTGYSVALEKPYRTIIQLVISHPALSVSTKLNYYVKGVCYPVQRTYAENLFRELRKSKSGSRKALIE